MTSSSIARGALIAALYAVATVLLAPWSYGQIQVRVSEALTVLAYVEPAAIPGLYLGVLIANVYGGFGPWDIFLGSFLTLIAALMTWRISQFARARRKGTSQGYFWPAVALLPPVVVNAFGVALIFPTCRVFSSSGSGRLWLFTSLASRC
ncbi:MAG: QueT transporter family protein [Terriglobia bacterium]